MSKLAGVLGIATAVIGGLAVILEAVAKSRDGDGDGDGDLFYPVSDDAVDWFCDCCGVFMNSQPYFSTVTGTWICVECGYVNDVSEDNIIQEDKPDCIRGNRIPLKKKREYTGRMPSCCSACGGPYPDCKTSCKIFDD